MLKDVDVSSDSSAAIDALVVANRILADRGVVDGFGHVSVRSPAKIDRFLLARSMAPGTVTVGDINEYDLDGCCVGRSAGPPYLERFIHTELYRARPDVGAVVHSHSPAVIPFGVTGARLRPIFHMSAFLGASVPVFDIKDTAGDTDMLIRTAELGHALAASVGDGAAVLQRGHGSTVVGATLAEAVFRAVYLEVNARLQMDATKLGPITFLSPGEVSRAAATVTKQIERAWSLWAAAVNPTLKDNSV